MGPGGAIQAATVRAGDGDFGGARNQGGWRARQRGSADAGLKDTLEPGVLNRRGFLEAAPKRESWLATERYRGDQLSP